jgi:hypothetical protein
VHLKEEMDAWRDGCISTVGGRMKFISNMDVFIEVS